MNLRHVMLAAVALAALAAPHYLYPVFLMKVLCFALFASSLNLLVGYVGLLSFGHAMFFGCGGYVAGYLLLNYGLTAEIAIGTAVLVAAALGAIGGRIAIGRHGIYFAMITLALAQMFYFLCVQSPLTGGENGLPKVPRPPLFGLIDIQSDMSLYYFVLATVSLALFGLYRAVYSPFGQVLRSIKDNETRAISLGMEVQSYKLLAFILSAAAAGLAGALKVLVFQFASLADVHWMTSGEVILMTLVGGIGTIAGPIVGAVVIVTMQNYLSWFGEWVLVIQGAIFFCVVLVFRRGIVGELLLMLKRARSA